MEIRRKFSYSVVAREAGNALDDLSFQVGLSVLRIEIVFSLTFCFQIATETSSAVIREEILSSGIDGAEVVLEIGVESLSISAELIDLAL